MTSCGMGTEAREKDAVRNKVARRMMPRHDHWALPFVALLPDVGSKGHTTRIQERHDRAQLWAETPSLYQTFFLCDTIF